MRRGGAELGAGAGGLQQRLLGAAPPKAQETLRTEWWPASWRTRLGTRPHACVMRSGAVGARGGCVQRRGGDCEECGRSGFVAASVADQPAPSARPDPTRQWTGKGYNLLSEVGDYVEVGRAPYQRDRDLRRRARTPVNAPQHLPRSRAKPAQRNRYSTDRSTSPKLHLHNQ